MRYNFSIFNKFLGYDIISYDSFLDVDVVFCRRKLGRILPFVRSGPPKTTGSGQF